MLDPVFAPTFAITYTCDMFQHCRYCYAKEFAQKKTRVETMPVERFQRLASLFKGCGVKEVVLVGGEPTMHPHFGAFLSHISSLGLEARIFSNGFYPGSRREMITSSPALRTMFFHYDDHYLACRGRVFRRRYLDNLSAAADAGKKIYLRVNFHRTDFNFRGLVRLAGKVGADIAYSFTTPAPGDVPYVRLAEYRKYLPGYRAFATLLKERKIKAALARPLPLCMFKGEKDAAFFREYADLHTTCVAINDLTVNPDGGMQLCLVTFGLTTTPVKDKRDLLSKINYLKKTEARLRQLPPSPECAGCAYFPGRCQGGCFSFHVYSREAPQKFLYQEV